MITYVYMYIFNSRIFFMVKYSKKQFKLTITSYSIDESFLLFFNLLFFHKKLTWLHFLVNQSLIYNKLACVIMLSMLEFSFPFFLPKNRTGRWGMMPLLVFFLMALLLSLNFRERSKEICWSILVYWFSRKTQLKHIPMFI